MVYVPKSAYIRNRIKGKRFSNKKFRGHIEDLVFLERAITEGIHGWAGNYHLGNLKSAYSEDYEAMLKELDPKEYERYIKDKKDKEKENHEWELRWQELERKELEEEKHMWKSLGGLE